MPAPALNPRTTKSLLGSVIVVAIVLVSYLAKQRGWIAVDRNAPVAHRSDNAPNPSATSDQDSIAELIRSKRSNVIVEASGVVTKVLPDDNEGDRHQRLLVEVGGNTILIAHNIDLASRVPVRAGDTIRFKGEYEYNDRGGVIHWTHRATGRNHAAGWIEVGGKRYE